MRPTVVTAVVNADGNLTYTPTADFNGPTIFNFTVVGRTRRVEQLHHDVTSIR